MAGAIVDQDDRPGAAPAIVISDALWQRRFNRDGEAIGKALAVNGLTFTIVGVAPPDFVGVFGFSYAADFSIPWRSSRPYFPRMSMPGRGRGGCASWGESRRTHEASTFRPSWSHRAERRLGRMEQIMCVGPAVPILDWTSYGNDPSSVPDRCADGSTGTFFSNASPNVTLCARDFAPHKTVRSNLSWSGTVLARLPPAAAYGRRRAR